MPRKPFKRGNKEAVGGAREGAGRPPDWLREECRKHAPNILDFLRQVALGEDVEQIVTDKGEILPVPAPVKERIKAGEILLNRGYGMPNQPLSGPEGESFAGIPTISLSTFVDALRLRVIGNARTGIGKKERG